MKNSHQGVQRRISIFAVGAGLVLIAVCPASAYVATMAQFNGGITFPDSGPGSIGNESGLGADSHSGVIVGGSPAFASFSLGGSGVDGNGTTGNVNLQASALAEVGALHASCGISASSHASGLAPFPHAGGAISRNGYNAAFWDTVTFFNPHFASTDMLTVTVTLELDWRGSVTNTPNQNSVASADAVGGVEFQDSLSLSEFRDSFGGYTHRPVQTTTFQILNGTTRGVFAGMSAYAGASISGSTPDQVDTGASSDAFHTVHLYIDGLDSATTVIGETGHNYSSSVPAPGMISVVGAVAAFGSSRRRK